LPVFLDLMLSFAKVGLLAWGGGPAMVPLLRDEVLRKGWMTEAEFTDALATGFALPGPIATKLALYVGYHEAGWLGAASSLVGVVLPSGLLILGLVALGSSFRDHPRVEGMMTAVRPVVIAMLVMMVVDLIPGTITEVRGLVIGVLALLLLALRLPPAAVIGAAALLGATFLTKG
jgi:chromate transporter